MKTYRLTYGCADCDGGFWEEKREEGFDFGTECPNCKAEIPEPSSIEEEDYPAKFTNEKKL